MRKILAILALLTLALLTACGGNETVSISPKAAADKLAAAITVANDQLVEAPKEVIDEWYAFDDKVTDFTVYVSGTSGTANEIAVVKSGDVKTAEEALLKRVEDLKTRFQDYVPAEMTKLQDPLIITKGDMAILVLCDDKAAAEKAVAETVK